ncbi:MAG: sigma-70 family RNA polymerase sigma factor [Bacteroidota bacterium]
MTIAFNNKKRILNQIRQGDEEALVKVYTKHKTEFINWSKKQYGLNNEQSEDIYQDTIIAFYNNIKSNRLVELNSSIKTYLFAIAKNLAVKSLKKSGRQLSEENIIVEPQTLKSDQVDEVIQYNERIELIAGLVEKLKEPNRSILKLYYFQNLSMEEIAKKLNYKNDKVVKAQKVRCMNELKKKVREMCLKDDLKD